MWFQRLTGSELAPVNVVSWPGLIFVVGVGVTPLAYFVLLGPFRNLDRSTEEASRIAGASMPHTLFRITLPMLSPAILGTSALGLILGLQAFELPQLIGRPAGIKVFSTQIYSSIYDETPSEYAQANALALLLMVLVILLFVGQLLITRKRSFATVTGKGFRPEPTNLGKVRWLLTAFVVVFGLCNPVLPLTSVVLGSFQPVFGVFGDLTAENYQKVWTDPTTQASLHTTFLLACLGGLVAILLVFATTYLALRGTGWFSMYSRLVTWIPWMMPGIVLSLSVLWAYSVLPVLQVLYGTIMLMILALVVEVSPLGGRVAEGALAQVSKELEEASRTSGASATRMFVGIVLRLVLPSFLAGWFLAALRISGDLSIPVLLSSASTRPVSLTAYELHINGETAAAAALSCSVLAMVIAALLAAGLVRALLRRRRPRPATLVEAGQADMPVMATISC